MNRSELPDLRFFINYQFLTGHFQKRIFQNIRISGSRFIIIVTSLVVLFNSCIKEENAPKTISATFYSSDTLITAGDSVLFTDTSTGEPNQWDWFFEGGQPERSTGQNQVVIYNTPGYYNVSLRVENEDSEDLILKKSLIHVQNNTTPNDTFMLGEEFLYGFGNQHDIMLSLIQLKNQSFLGVGWSIKNSSNYGSIRIAFFDSLLNLSSHKELDGSDTEIAWDVIQTTDGGFLIGGITWSDDGDIPANNGQSDVLLIRLNSNAEIQWIKNYGGTSTDHLSRYSLLQTHSGFAFIASTFSDDIDVSSSNGRCDIWLVHLDENGEIQNSVTIGGAGNDHGYSLVEAENSFVILALTGTPDSIFNQQGLWVLNLKPDGQINWKTFIGDYVPGRLIKTKDGGYITMNSAQQNSSDLIVSRLDKKGILQWEYIYPIAQYGYPEDIAESGDEYLVLGSSKKPGSGTVGDCYLLRLNTNGKLLQEIKFGNLQLQPRNIIPLNSNKLLIGGSKKTDATPEEFWLQLISTSKGESSLY